MLQPGDCVADGGLRAGQLFRRRRKTTRLYDRLQDLPFIQGGVHDTNDTSKKSIPSAQHCTRLFDIMSAVMNSPIRKLRANAADALVK
jgi:hypothetical protein